MTINNRRLTDYLIAAVQMLAQNYVNEIVKLQHKERRKFNIR